MIQTAFRIFIISIVIPSLALAGTTIKIDRAEASHNPFEAKNAFDGISPTRWSTGTPQEPGQYIMFILNQAANINGIELKYNDSANDGPAGYEVYVTIDPRNPGKPAAVGTSGTGSVKITFEPKYGSYIKIVQTRKKERLYWSIHEIDISFADEDITFDSGIAPIDVENEPFMDTRLDVEARLDNLMTLMTPAEKLGLVLMGNPVERLKVPAMRYTEAIHGFTSSATGKATIFPHSIAIGATFDKDLAYRVGKTIGNETAVTGIQQAWSPVLDVCRDPRWGRCEETYGEDSYLVTEMGCAWIAGFQSEGVIATPKHLAGHGGALLGGRDSHEIGLSEREMREIHLPPFRKAFREIGCQSTMQHYSGWLGTPSATSSDLLIGILREEWGFDGFIVSDCYSIRFLCKDKHYIYGDVVAASKAAIEATISRNCGKSYNAAATIAAAEKGEIDMDQLNTVVKNLLRVLMLRGDFENPPPAFDANKVYPGWESAEHKAVALEAAQKCMTLLRNEKELLPLDKSTKRIAVIGPGADNVQTGDYSARAGKDQLISVFEGVTAKLGAQAEIKHAVGCDFTDPDKSGFAEAVKIAKDSDVAIVVVGDKSEGENKDGGKLMTSGENHDKARLNLPGVQEDLVQAIAKTGTPVVLAVTSGRPYTIEYANDVDAILYTWYAGQETGVAVADVLFGDINPAGRLPVTLPKMTAQLPLYYDFIPSGRRYTYADGDAIPRGKFGFGLSYTTFQYRDLQISEKPDGSFAVSVKVTNIGNVSGDEVVQLYLTDMFASVQTRIMMLKGFDRIHLKPEETKTVTFKLAPYDLSLLNQTMDRVVEKGQFKVSVGGASPSFGIKHNGDAIKDQMFYKDDTEGLFGYFDVTKEYSAKFAYTIQGITKNEANVRVTNNGNLTDVGKLKMFIGDTYSGQSHRFELEPGKNKTITYSLDDPAKKVGITFVGKYSKVSYLQNESKNRAAPVKNGLTTSQLLLQLSEKPYSYELIERKTGQKILSHQGSAMTIDGREYSVSEAKDISAGKDFLEADLILSGTTKFGHVKFTVQQDDRIQVILSMADDKPEKIKEIFADQGEHYYGLWEYPYGGNIDNRGANRELIGSALEEGTNWANARAPFYVTSAKYGIYVDTMARGHYSIANDGQTSFDFKTNKMTYTIFYGPDYASILSQYNEVAGAAFMPPDWAFDSIWWRDDDYKDMGHLDPVAKREIDSAQDNVEATANFLQFHQIPASVIWIDRPFGSGKWGWGNMDFDSTGFADPQAMIDTLDKQGYALLLWIANRCYDNLLKEGSELGYLFEGVKPIGGPHSPAADLRIPEAYSWFQEKLDTFVNMGIKGYKIDRGHEKGIPFDFENEVVYLGAKMCREGMAKRHGQDCLIFVRNLYDKARQYVGHWNGDTDGTFGGLRVSVKNGIRCGAINQSYWGSDIGGYFGVPTEELFIRWIQFGTYCPMMETLIGPARTIWYPEDFDLTKSPNILEITKKQCQDHHDLIPYVRSFAYENTQTGMSIIHPLIFAYPNDENLYDMWDQYMFGSEILVAPVVEKGAASRDVYLPEGQWLDYNNKSTVYNGAATITANAPIDVIPVYVKGGAIIPRGDILKANNNWTENWKPSLRIEFFPTKGISNSFNYYTGSNVRSIDCTMAANGDIHITCPDLTISGNLEIYCKAYRSVSQNGKLLVQGEGFTDDNNKIIIPFEKDTSIVISQAVTLFD